jgi:hypothetical protein
LGLGGAGFGEFRTPKSAIRNFLFFPLTPKKGRR